MVVNKIEKLKKKIQDIMIKEKGFKYPTPDTYPFYNMLVEFNKDIDKKLIKYYEGELERLKNEG